MDNLEEEIQGQMRKVSNDLCLESGKSLKLESNSQLGYHFRITLKVRIVFCLLMFINVFVKRQLCGVCNFYFYLKIFFLLLFL